MSEQHTIADAPIPLARAVEVPPFPVAALPVEVADMVSEVAVATQTDPAMAATSALSALSACTGGHAVIEIRSGWREPLNLYAVTIAAPGERKSAVQQVMVGALYDVEHEMVEDALPERMQLIARKGLADKLSEQAVKKGDLDAIIKAQQAADAIEIPPEPRLLADDVTPEAAATLLAEHSGRLAIISAEGGIFDIIAGRYSARIPNLDIWLKGHSGDPVKIDRKNRAPEYIRRPALTLGLMVQPSVLTTIASNREFRGRGLLARFLYSYPVSKVGHREIAATPVSSATRGHYNELVGDLARCMSQWCGDPAVLTLAPKAHDALIAIEEAVEPTLAGDGELAPLADWGAKYVGALARIAGILHLARYGEQGARIAVEADTIAAAARIGEYFKACAIRAFNEMGMDADTTDAQYLLDRVTEHYGNGAIGDGTVSARDLFNLTKKRFGTMKAIKPAIERLVDFGWLKPVYEQHEVEASRARGRPSSPRYLVWYRRECGACGHPQMQWKQYLPGWHCVHRPNGKCTNEVKINV